jgi:hypothetical protein
VEKTRGGAPWKLIGFIVLVVAFLGLVALLGADATRYLAQQMAAYRSPMTLWIAGAVYTILLAIPGVPGVEIGLLMILMFGGEGAIAVYALTILALNTSFAMGRWLPSVKWVRRWMPNDPHKAHDANAVYDTNAAQHTDASPPAEQDAKLKLVLQRSRAGRWVLKFMSTRAGLGRYVLVAFLLNMPGNFVLGGGGGIGLLCGLNRQFSWFGFFVMVALAAIPLPVLAFLGVLQLDFLTQAITSE